MGWVLATIIAAAAQTARNAMQNSLTGTLGTLGATQVRFIYGFPFALLFLLAMSAAVGTVPSAPSTRFIALTAMGAVAQIFGTASLLLSMQGRSFSVATAFSKTEPVQVALFGFLLLHERLPVGAVAGIVIATLGVLLVAAKPGDAWDAKNLQPAAYGIASGGFFAIAAVGFRGGILAAGDAPYYLRAATTLVWSLGIQSALLASFMLAFDRPKIVGSFHLWRQSIFAGFIGAFASQFWFLGMSLTAAANVRTLALIEVLFAQVVSRRIFRERPSSRELAGIAMMLAGVAALMIAVRP